MNKVNPKDGGNLIYVSKTQLSQVEYLIGQSILGNHSLFDVDSIRRVFQEPLNVPMDDSQAYEVEHHIEKLIQLPTLMQKRAYLEKLDHLTFRLVVRTYFNIVENNLFESQEVDH